MVCLFERSESLSEFSVLLAVVLGFPGSAATGEMGYVRTKCLYALFGKHVQRFLMEIQKTLQA